MRPLLRLEGLASLGHGLGISAVIGALLGAGCGGTTKAATCPAPNGTFHASFSNVASTDTAGDDFDSSRVTSGNAGLPPTMHFTAVGDLFPTSCDGRRSLVIQVPDFASAGATFKFGPTATVASGNQTTVAQIDYFDDRDYGTATGNRRWISSMGTLTTDAVTSKSVHISGTAKMVPAPGQGDPQAPAPNGTFTVTIDGIFRPFPSQ